jgi:hypothetical protein
MTTTLNDRALLVQLSISQWTARKLDKRVTADVAAANNAAVGAGNYNKVLLPGADELAAIHQLSTAIRTKFYDNTLAWSNTGQQLLPSANYLAFMTEFRTMRNEWNARVSKFVSVYPSLLASAPMSLGKLFNPSDYPPANELHRKFDMDIAVMPVPTNDFRVSIAGEELSRIQQDVEERVNAAYKGAMGDVWQRLFDRVAHIAEKCADPRAIFRDSMIENARELCAMLPRLNFTDDPDLERLRLEVEGKLLCHPEALRNDPELRRDTASAAKSIMDAMGAFMGN